MKKYGLSVMLLAIFVVGLSGCATMPEPTVKEKFDAESLVWPPPPDEPRIKWVASYTGSRDIQEENSVLRFIGEENVVVFRRPHGIVADRKGNIFVTDTELLKVFKFDFEKKKFSSIGDSGFRQVKIPMGLAVDNDRGYLFIADLGNKMVMVFDKESGSFKFAIGQEAGTFARPASIALDVKAQKVYVADTKLHVVKAFDYNGRFLFSIGRGDRSSEDDGFNVPSSVTVGRDGNLYVSDMFNRYVKIFSPEGKFVKKIGQGVGSGFGNFSKLVGVALDSEGHLYGLDIDFGNFQIFDTGENRLLTYVAASGRSPGQLLLPTTIFIDEKDRIYVTDTFNQRVQVFQYLSRKR